MFWKGEPFWGAIVSRNTIGDETVYAIVHLGEGGNGVPTQEGGLPIVSMAVARDYNVRSDAENAYSARTFKRRLITLGRKRGTSPVEIVGIE